MLKWSPPELLLKDVKVVSRFKVFSVYLHTCSHSPAPLLCSGNMGGSGYEFPGEDPFHQGSSLLIWTQQRDHFAGLCLSCQYRTRAEDEQSQTAGSPAHTELVVSVGDVPGSCRPQATAPASAESQCAARCLEPDFSPSPPRASSVAEKTWM